MDFYDFPLFSIIYIMSFYKIVKDVGFSTGFNNDYYDYSIDFLNFKLIVSLFYQTYILRAKTMVLIHVVCNIFSKYLTK